MNKDVLSLIALKLEIKDIFSFSKTCKKIYSSIWENNIFWRNKFNNEFHITKPFYCKDFLKLYNLFKNTSDNYRGFSNLVYINENMLRFLKESKFSTTNSNLSANDIIAPILSFGLIPRILLTDLFLIFIKINNISVKCFLRSHMMVKYFGENYVNRSLLSFLHSQTFKYESKDSHVQSLGNKTLNILL